jgi:hypothetical protein
VGQEVPEIGSGQQARRRAHQGYLALPAQRFCRAQAGAAQTLAEPLEATGIGSPPAQRIETQGAPAARGKRMFVTVAEAVVWIGDACETRAPGGSFDLADPQSATSDGL